MNPPLTRQFVLDRIAAIRPELRAFRIQKLELFGSVARNEATESSDVDLLVEFEPGFKFGLFHLAKVEIYLEEAIGGKVDLVLRDCVYDQLRDRIYGEAIRAA